MIMYDAYMDDKDNPRVTIYFTMWLLEKVKELAGKDDRTVSGEIRHLIRLGIKSKEEEK